jgi:predicted nucleic acid-binding protein
MVGDGRIAVESSVEMVQELVHVLLRRHGDRPAAVAQAQNVGRLCGLHDFVAGDLMGAMDLYLKHPALDMRDAVYVATARSRGIEHVISTDRAFEGIEGLIRVDPADAVAVAALADEGPVGK